MRIGHRLRQFLSAWRASIGAEDRAVLVRYLNVGERALFERMELADQRHCVDVFSHLRRQGQESQDLLRAALLHDVGKVEARFGLRIRGAIVLLEGLNARMLARIASNKRDSWRYCFYVHEHHARIGAEMARQAGCSSRVISLISQHDQPHPSDEMAVLLYQADWEN
ncbi:MAG: HDIG domain-containing protein [Chloroflexi bacterium]|nr:HDIG domain-containing protein [Chloroflexota bacterium]MCL5075595.1 HDIG domain-containing protein [Chloroflexota bacterium]